MTPVTTPVPAPTVATEVVLLDQLPPVVTSVKVVVVLVVTVNVPAIGAGKRLTVTTLVALALPQLLVTVKDMVVVPAVAPVTDPVLVTKAMEGTLLVQPMPPAPSVNDVDEPTHTDATPVMVPALGDGFTVTTLVALALPQLLVTL